IRAFGLGQGAIGLQAPWIEGVVLVGSELGGVDEDADGYKAHRLMRRTDQRSVAQVQGAHGGHQSNGVAAVVAFPARPRAEILDRTKDFHQTFRSGAGWLAASRARRAGSGR